jgi:heat shock protein HtpX
MSSQNSSIVKGLMQRCLWLPAFAQNVQSLSIPEAYFLQPEKAPKVYGVVRELSEKMGITSEIPVMISKDANVSAISLLRGCGFICLGEELVNQLSDDEIKGVIAHELAQIRNYHSFILLLSSPLMIPFL